MNTAGKSASAGIQSQYFENMRGNAFTTNNKGNLSSCDSLYRLVKVIYEIKTLSGTTGKWLH